MTYLEFRPGVGRVLSVMNVRPAGVESTHPNAEVVEERIRTIATDTLGLEDPDDIEEWVDQVGDAWEEAEDGGALIVTEVDYEEAAA